MSPINSQTFLEVQELGSKKNTSNTNGTYIKQAAFDNESGIHTKSGQKTIFYGNTITAGISSGKTQSGSHFSSHDAELLKMKHPWRKKSHKKVFRMALLLFAYAAATLLLNSFRAFSSSSDHYGEQQLHLSGDSSEGQILQRNERFADDSSTTEAPHCIPRSVENFPGNFMSYKDTKNGGFTIHILIAFYMFAAIAIICDDYFVPSLEHICEDLGLQADVAGATFMAAGSSAPEFMTSVIGVFFAKSDVGVGTIVGSAVFNILFIIGVCGVFAGMVVELTWYPLIRDTIFYLLSVLTLYLAIRDKSVEWYEALVMLLMYFAYIVIMYFNRPMEKKSRAFVRQMKVKLGYQALVEPVLEVYSVSENMQRARAHSRISHTLSASFSRDYPMTHEQSNTPQEDNTPVHKRSSEVDRPLGADKSGIPENETLVDKKQAQGAGVHEDPSKVEAAITVSEYQNVWEFPENFFLRCIWVAMCPVKALFFFTVPDSRRPGLWARLYMLSFTMSVLWISGLTYLMVWMVTVAGDAMDIPDTVMGLTLLAAGTSVPDCLSSVFVARDGYGDMAVSNSLGSNVFDILMCLGLPWLIECAIKQNSVEIDSAGLTYSTLTLLSTVVFLLISMGVNKWKLTKAYGFLCLLAYVIVITLTCLFELNIFGDINPPAC